MNKMGSSIATTAALLFVAYLALLPTHLNAQVLYQQATLETTDRGAYQDFCQQLADDFVPTMSGNAGNITWQGSYYDTDNPAGTESFTVQIFADNAGLPADAPLYEIVGDATKTDSGSVLLGKTLYDYSLPIASPVLDAGTTYWVSVYTNEPCSNFAWSNSTDGTADGALRNSGGAWSALDGDLRSNHVFTLTIGSAPPPPEAASVPALHPALLAVLAFALAGLGVLRFRKIG